MPPKAGTSKSKGQGKAKANVSPDGGKQKKVDAKLGDEDQEQAPIQGGTDKGKGKAKADTAEETENAKGKAKAGAKKGKSKPKPQTQLQSEAKGKEKSEPLEEQDDIVDKRDRNVANTVRRLRLQIEEHKSVELYHSPYRLYNIEGKPLSGFETVESQPFPEKGLDLRTLAACSSSAEDWFAYAGDIMPLPLEYPRRRDHDTKQYYGIGIPRAYIRAHEIVRYVILWLNRMEGVVYDVHNTATRRVFQENLFGEKDTPQIAIPDDLLEKIHLYNAMLQLGIAFYFQRDLIDALVNQMQATDLKNCHLDTLEMTIGRFYSSGIPALDPVPNHLIGEYAFRTNKDCNFPEPPRGLKILDAENEVDELSRKQLFLPKGEVREWLEYKDVHAQRLDYPDDTVIVPPKLEVLGRAIRHWSGVRRRGKTRARAAYMGYTLNIGKVYKWYTKEEMRRDGARVLHRDYFEYDTCRLRSVTTRPGTWTGRDPIVTAAASETTVDKVDARSPCMVSNSKAVCTILSDASEQM